MNVEYLDHTADSGFIIHAQTLETLFTTAATEMFNIICPYGDKTPKTFIRMHVTGDSGEELLVNWLSELNFYFETRQYLFSRAKQLQINENSCTATAGFDKVDPKRHTVETEIKAVTYHGLYLKRENDIWKTQIIFDL